MTKSCWEKGTIKFGTREWKPFRERVISHYNDMQARCLALNLKAYEALKSELKGRRGTARDQHAERVLQRVTGKTATIDALLALLPPGKDFPELPWMDHELPIFGELALHAIRKPLKKDYAPAPPSKDFSVSGDGWSATLCNQTRTLHWEVFENNHAVEQAHQDNFVRGLFRALDDVSFSRGNGGQIVGNDEYNRDSDWAGGGGNYVTHEYTPGESKASQRRSLSRQPSPRFSARSRPARSRP